MLKSSELLRELRVGRSDRGLTSRSVAYKIIMLVSPFAHISCFNQEISRHCDLGWSPEILFLIQRFPHKIVERIFYFLTFVVYQDLREFAVAESVSISMFSNDLLGRSLVQINLKLSTFFVHSR